MADVPKRMDLDPALLPDPTRLSVHQFTVVSSLPLCSFNRCTQSARYDFKSKDGPWGNGCDRHYLEHRLYTELGTGKGQRLMLPDEPKPLPPHRHPTVSAFNRTGQRFIWSLSNTRPEQLTLYRWDPPAGYTPCLTLTHDPSREFRRTILNAFTNEYPLSCGCVGPCDVLDYDVHVVRED